MPFRRRRRRRFDTTDAASDRAHTISDRAHTISDRAHTISDRARHALQRSAATVCEKLESRQLLTALVNGQFQGTGTAFDGGTFFDYAQPNSTHVRISVFGNVTAEFIGGRYDPARPSNVSLAELIPFAPGVQSDVWLFSIYVVHADMNSTISIAEMTGNPLHMDSQTAGEPIRFANSVSGALAQPVPAGIGGVYLGAKTPANFPGNTNNIPLIYADERRFGMRPSSAGALFAGLEVAPGNDLGRFMLGGAITGLVDVPGNMQTFYAGAVLTGDAQGIYALNTTNDGPVLTTPFFTGFPPQGNAGFFPNKNFHIGGDIRNLMSGTSFGTLTLSAPPGTPPELQNTVYKTGTQIDIGGRVGQIKGLDSFMGVVEVRNNGAIQSPGIAQKEFEFRGPNIVGFSYFDPSFVGNDVVPGNTAPATAWANDTFDTAQWLGTTFSRSLHTDQGIQLNGSIGNDFGQGGDNIDFYAVPLLAGQAMEVQLAGSPTTIPAGPITIPFGISSGLAIEDPDGRIIATNYSSLIQGFRHNAPIRIVADRPGAYRIVVARFGDINFNGAADNGEGLAARTPDEYQLRIQKVGDLALGGLIMDNDIATTDQGSKSIVVDKGDLGEVRAGLVGGRLVGTIWSWANPWQVTAGNLRAIEASDFGIYTGQPIPVFAQFQVEDVSGPDLLVRRGSIGLLRQTETGGSLVVNDDQSVFPTEDDDLNLVDKNLAVGNQIQVVDAAGQLGGALLAKGAIGVIRAASVNTLLDAQTVWMADVDKTGGDGFIDLIDVPGAFNGPAIWTGPNGNVRYMHLSTDPTQVTRDTRFAVGGTPDVIRGAPGQKIRVTDDSGTAVTLTPTPLERNQFIGIGQPQFLDPPILQVRLYPIRSGGSAIIEVTAFPPAVPLATENSTVSGGGGLLVDTGRNGSLGTVEIGQINVPGNGTGAVGGLPPVQTATGIGITFDPILQTYTETAQPVAPSPATPTIRPINLEFNGPGRVDVWNISAPGTVTFTNVINRTPGDIVNITPSDGSAGPDIENLQAENIGIASHHTAADLNGIAVVDNVYPFVGVRHLVQVGDLATVSARQAIGNILASNIGEMAANSDGRNVKGVFEGIVGPIYALNDGTLATGNIVGVNIGEGVAPTGSGAVSFSGLYADNVITSISGNNADIRGNIVASGIVPVVAVVDPVTQISSNAPIAPLNSIRLRNGSIIGATISTEGIIANTTQLTPAISGVFLDRGGVPAFDTVDNPIPEIGAIRIDGNGGIIGSIIKGADIGAISVNGGYGIIFSTIVSLADNTIGTIDVDGYGLRGDLIEVGGILQRVSARGTGKRIATTAFNANVRLSEKYDFDPSGAELDALNDLHIAMGTSAANPIIKGVSDTGIIQDTVIHGGLRLDRVDAQRIIARNIVAPDPRTGVNRIVPFGDSAYPMQINFGTDVGKINVRDIVDGLSLDVGSLTSFSARNNVQNASLIIRGRAKSLTAGMFRGTTTIQTIGGEGQIDYLGTTRSLYATVNSSQDIITTKIGTDVGSPKFYTSGTMRHLFVNGSILSGAHVRAARRIISLYVGHDIKAGATVSTRRLDNQTIGGQVLGDIIITPTP